MIIQMKKLRRVNNLIFIASGVLIILSTAFLLTQHKEEFSLGQEYKEAGGEIVVIFNQGIEQNELDNVIKTFPVPVEIKRHIDNYVLFYVNEEEGYQNVMERLEKNPLVKAVEANHSISTMGFSNDRYADTQWAINNPGQYMTFTRTGKEYLVSTADVDMDVAEAWDYIKKETTERQEVIVAVLDTGIDYKHPDLADHMWVNNKEIPEDGVDNDNNGYIDDVFGWDFYNGDSTTCHYEYSDKYQMEVASKEDNDDHGTHVAGIIGAATDNNIGIAGTASNIDVKIMTLKINGGPDGTGSISSAVEAVKYATMMGADIANMSWGTTKYTEVLSEAMKESDILFVAAAGNTGTDNDTSPVYPANLELDNLISATFIDADGKLTKLSNYGKATVDLAAPGDNIFSTVVGTYASMGGSSMAAPQVSAVAALLYSYQDNLYPVNVKEHILQNIKTLSKLEGYLRNPGIPNAYQSVMSADRLIRDIVPPELSLDTIYNKGQFQIPVTAKDKGGAGIRVIKWLNGERTIADFNRGITGMLVEDDTVFIEKAGLYTFYISDYAGNDTITTYEVVDDKTPPKISSYYSVANTYKTRTVTVKVSDKQSGIKRVKYMEGKKVAKDFLPAGAGTEVTLKSGKGSFKIEKDGIYSIFSIDNRGNTTVKQIKVKTIKATELKFSRSQKTLYIGDKYSLQAVAKPEDTTDTITYTSSNKEVATVSKAGRVTALKTGKTTITAISSSGKKAVYEVKVVKK